ncbi:hypothetical protein [Niallia sp. NCCP-28]|uniref:hypothetical protein n=1 Tax=Niallia sp. NCCP-28 TaxID=2934712 RepID=UPI0020824263|nr:hypothetical protein [Niallia sp. NCCP-28]GKU82726.1 hypothetical protein NCCP28_21220 [Niallia sp. NCCP-28]
MNKKVLYKGQIYTILFRYETGYCEIRDSTNPFKVKLVHCSELTTVHTAAVCNNLI